MRLPESVKQLTTAVIKKTTDEFRKTYKVRIHAFYGTDGELKVVMEDGHIKVGFSYNVQFFEDVGNFIIRQYPGDFALYFGIFWKDQLNELYSVYSKELKRKATEVLNKNV